MIYFGILYAIIAIICACITKSIKGTTTFQIILIGSLWIILYPFGVAMMIIEKINRNKK